MNVRKNTTLISCVCSVLLASGLVLEAATVTGFKEKKDDFSNNNVSILTLITDNTQEGGLFVSCYPPDLQVQLHVKEVIFPDNAQGGSMQLKVTHKVDTASKATTATWKMNIGKYHDAWLTSGVETLIQDMKSGEKLALQLNKNGTIYRFDLNEARDHLEKVVAACKKNKGKQP